VKTFSLAPAEVLIEPAQHNIKCHLVSPRQPLLPFLLHVLEYHVCVQNTPGFAESRDPGVERDHNGCEPLGLHMLHHQLLDILNPALPTEPYDHRIAHHQVHHGHCVKHLKCIDTPLGMAVTVHQDPKAELVPLRHCIQHPLGKLAWHGRMAAAALDTSARMKLL
jgi:hypothetical protein